MEQRAAPSQALTPNTRPQVLDKDFLLPIGKAKVMRSGTDVTLVSFSKMVGFCLKAAETLQAQGISCEVRGGKGAGVVMVLMHEVIGCLAYQGRGGTRAGHDGGGRGGTRMGPQSRQALMPLLRFTTRTRKLTQHKLVLLPRARTAGDQPAVHQAPGPRHHPGQRAPHAPAGHRRGGVAAERRGRGDRGDGAGARVR